MANLVVQAPATVTGAAAGQRLLDRLRGDGHVASAPEGDVLGALREADGCVVVLDGNDASTVAAIAAGAAMGTPVLALTGRGAPAPITDDLVTYAPGLTEEEWWVTLDDWYDVVRPFAGRVVRDLIPRLVQEAGHDVSFRPADETERPRFLKQKVLQEARELVAASAGEEKEEIGDLLEALEALIRVRSYDQESLRRVKAAKRKQRGGFERCWVVEETAPKAKPEATATAEFFEI